MAKAIGIDLGTTFSAVAVVEAGKPHIIVNAEGDRTTPSVVMITKDGEIIVGKHARNQAILHPERVVRSIKRHMGEKYKVTIDGKDYTPEQISAMILQKLKQDAEAYLGEEVKDAVITVPAYFNDAQRKATKDAGTIAGFNVLRIINEPTAAALAYGIDKSKDHIVMVFDFGGGTFDVSILEISEGVFEVKATSGNNHLGGDDIDQIIMDWLIDDFKKQYGIDLNEDRQALQRLKEAAEKAKIELSTKSTTTISLPFIYSDSSGPKHINKELTRAEFEKLIEPILEKLKGPTLQAMKDAKITKEDIDQVLLVGGSTRIPAVQRLVKEITGKEPNKSVNPDEAVALGAALQAAIIKGEVKDVVLLDVTPLSLGIETLGGVFTKIIERNTTIPVRRSKIFTTAEDNQTAVTIRVAQGERPMFADNKLLGQFDLIGIPPAPRGVPKIEVTFDIDANGILNVTAKDLGTGKEQSIRITAPNKLSKEEIERMIQEAQKYASEDERRLKLVEMRNKAENLIYTTEKTLKDLGDKIPENERKDIEEKIKQLREATESDDVNKIQEAMDNLLRSSHRIAEEVYKRAQTQQTQGQSQQDTQSTQQQSSQQNSKDEKIVDAEFKEEDKNNK